MILEFGVAQHRASLDSHDKIFATIFYWVVDVVVVVVVVDDVVSTSSF